MRPQDFVQIENADVVTESALFTYQVSSSDSAKLTASLDGNGNLLLTPVGDASGSVNVTVTATSRLDNSTASDTFSVQLNGGDGPVDPGPVDPGPVLTAIEEVGIALNRDSAGNLYAGSQPIYASSSQMTVTSLSGYTFMAVEDFGDTGGKQLVLKHNNGLVVTWQMNDAWSRTSNLANVLPGTQSLNNKEIDFSVDLDDDLDIGL